MNDNEYISKVICEQLECGSPLVLASIISLHGSSPRHIGTKMAISVEGKSYGTIGGSLLEATAIKEAKKTLLGKQSSLMEFDLAGDGAYSKGMICGGKAVVLLDYIQATKENLEFFLSWNEEVLAGNDFYSLTHFKESGHSIEIIGRCLLFGDGRWIGNCALTEPDVESVKAQIRSISTTSVLALKETRLVIDPIRKLKTLYCFGAGHVAVPTAYIAALVGFRVVVLDDRAEFANLERFPEAYKVCVIEDFSHAFEGLEIDSDSFIVIVTRGHQYDRAVLEGALKTEAGYIGMISSHKKRETIYEALMAKGVTRERLAQVHSPIGLPIGGETPEEIAVSIVAELVSVRSKQRV
jgi:xanthine dehydrogenase accessory factor